MEQEGYHVLKAYDGQEALDIMYSYTSCQGEPELHLLILDIMMPRLDGIHAMMKLRQKYSIPVILLSAKSEDTDKILGLNAGADDYITKPFNILEVKARIKAIIRRSSVSETKEPPKVYSYNGLRIDIESRRAYINDKEVNLTAKEFDLLELLMLHPNKVYGREELLNTVWGYDYPGDVRTVDVHIRRLREKIEESPSNPVFIHTKWGVGYYFQK